MAKHLFFFTGSKNLFRTCYRARSAEKVAWAIKYSALSMSHLETECRMTTLSKALCTIAERFKLSDADSTYQSSGTNGLLFLKFWSLSTPVLWGQMRSFGFGRQELDMPWTEFADNFLAEDSCALFALLLVNVAKKPLPACILILRELGCLMALNPQLIYHL